MQAGDLAGDLLWDVTSKTALVLAALYGVLWAVRRSLGRTAAGSRGSTITLVQSTHLGPGRSVHLIEVGGKRLLVGATSQQVSLLAEVGLAEADPELENEGAELPFSHYLRCAAGAAGARIARKKREDDGGAEERAT